MFEDQATVSSKGDIYSFGMTILQVSLNLVFVREAEVLISLFLFM